jgi:metaxin
MDHKMSPGTATDTPRHSLFTVPPSVRRLFERFPLVTYPANELPDKYTSLSRSRGRDEKNAVHRLYIWSTEERAARGRPSFNPSCLKWQVCN